MKRGARQTPESVPKGHIRKEIPQFNPKIPRGTPGKMLAPPTSSWSPCRATQAPAGQLPSPGRRSPSFRPRLHPASRPHPWQYELLANTNRPGFIYVRRLPSVKKDTPGASRWRRLAQLQAAGSAAAGSSGAGAASEQSPVQLWTASSQPHPRRPLLLAAGGRAPAPA